MVAQVTIRARTNADWKRRFKFGNPPRSLVDTRLVMHAKRKGGSAEAAEFSTDPGGGIDYVEAIEGDYTIKLQRKKLESLGAGEYVHDLIGIEPNGDTFPIWEGEMFIKQGVTVIP